MRRKRIGASGVAMTADAHPRIVHLQYGKTGGAERFFVALVRAFARRGLEQRFVIRRGQIWEAEVRALGPVSTPVFPVPGLTGPLLRAWLRRRCAAWRPDVVMAWAPRAARMAPALPGIRTITRLGDFPDHLRHFPTSDVLVGNIPGIVARARSLGWTNPAVVISNFARDVDPAPRPRAAMGTPEDAFVIVGGGRFVHRKGIDVLIRAAARVPGAWLWLAGDGPDRAALEALAREEGISDRTRFLGWLAEPIHAFAAADVLVMPSRHEPFGNIAIEGWRAGVPVVSTRSEGPDWYMTDGVDGLLVEIDDAAALADRLTRLRADPALRARLVEGGRATLARAFTEDAVVDAYLRLFAGDHDDPGRFG